ncbi:MAG: prepilin-type N-terminal cleavage/methylation domain-containing protein, partial [Candidatus Gastranaerophilales bacterium]|nr:prepilin-type N-terminal cleavage/methylation domain-containing protein [Candidatus Gastranaerophilales bacterium]
MNLNIFKKAFSLTELLIVLVIVAVLFSAMLPIMTKRKIGSTSTNEPVWMFVNEDDQKDAFYDPGTPSWTSTAFIGVDPLDIADFKPYSKVVLKAKKYQDMIQFRYGNNGNGNLAGVFAIDNKGNIITSSKLNGDDANNYNSIFANGSNNTIAGMTAAEKLKGTSGSTAVGARSMMGKLNSVPAPTTAVGKDSAPVADTQL